MSSSSLATRLESNYVDQFRLYDGIQGGSFQELDGITWFRSGISVAWMNGVLQTACPIFRQAEQAKKFVSIFQEDRIPMLWRLGVNSTETESLALKLAGQGLSYMPGEMGMISRSLISIKTFQEEFSITEIGNDEDIAAWLDIFVEAFELPTAARSFYHEYLKRSLTLSPQIHRYFLGRVGSVPVSCCFYLWSSNVLTIYGVGTKTAFRGRGYGAAITHFAASHGISAGLGPIALFAADELVGFYSKLGFESEYRLPDYHLQIVG